MAELIAKPALDGQGPVAKAGLVLSLLPTVPLWSVAPFPGANLTPLLAPLGLSFPSPGQVVRADDLSLMWTGREQAFLIGAAPPEGLAALAALTDQTGAWAAFALEGAGSEAALARLVSPDLRLAAFPVGRVIRTGLNHIPAILSRESETGIVIRVFRSMARTAWHELAEVLDRLEARAGGSKPGHA